MMITVEQPRPRPLPRTLREEQTTEQGTEFFCYMCNHFWLLPKNSPLPSQGACSFCHEGLVTEPSSTITKGTGHFRSYAVAS